MAKQPVGAVMVVGAGIGGMQSSIDLANSGFKVYLIERDTAIGGRMAMLDKTFPTNDCAMCIISPKLIEVGRHPNIEVMTNTEFIKLDGDPGNFTAKVKHHPRFVDLEKCTACGECAKVCPIEVPNEYNMGLDGRRAIRKRYPQAIPGGFAIEKTGTSPCRDACPSHVRAQGYVALIAEGRFSEALKVVRKDLPFPAVCGRVCPHPCEDVCNRQNVDSPIAIRDLKRFISDFELKAGKEALPEIAKETGKKIAIIGGGPSGLSAAWFLRLNGHKPTVFEAASEAGGMLRTGIPAYRLPRDILAGEIKTIEDLGVEIKCNSKIGENIKIDSLVDDYDALYIAGGAQLGRTMRLKGEDETKGVYGGVEYLRDVAFGNPPETGKRVAVIGGGNTAIDAARTALREGAKEVTLVYRRTLKEMPAEMEEIDEAKEEGVKLVYLAAPTKIIAENNTLTGIEVIEMELGEPDKSGRRRPIPKEGSEKTLEIDTLISAIGQYSDLDFLDGSKIDSIAARSWIDADSLTYETSIAGVFAGGDMQAGPGIAITAIAHGKEAAISIDRYLRGIDLRANREWNPHLAPAPKTTKTQKEARVKLRHSDPIKRSKLYSEFTDVMTEAEALLEASRCLQCGTCSECGLCEEVCEANAIDHNMLEYNEELDVGSIILSPGFDQFEAEALGEFGYGRWQNVVTSLDFERMLSATGPTEGHLARISDHKEPKKVAWIQCVGSRDQRNDRGYCSGVCCMFASKEAVIATDHAGGDFDATIFMMDLRATGKGFDEYCNRAKSKYGVKYVRSMVSRVDEMPENKDIEVTYVDEEGNKVKEVFDMLVLSTGLKPTSSVSKLAAIVGMDLDDYGFAKTDPFKPLATSRPGVFVCGVLQSPKDIPETVAQASGAAAAAVQGLAEARGTAITKAEFPDELDTESDEQKIGVIVCNCGRNIGSVVDVPDVADYASKIDGVVHSESVLFACSQDNQDHLKDIIKEKGLNRLVVASCTPRTHEPLFQATLKDCGINNYLFSMANIREQCAWVHQKEHGKATEKAKMLVKMAINNAKNLTPLHKQEQSLIHRGLIIGGGLAGMTSALELADQGFGVTIVEKSEKLGGNLHKINSLYNGAKISDYRDDLVGKVLNHQNIDVLLSSKLQKTDGFLGNFKTVIIKGDEKITVEHGTTIIATGGHESVPTSFGYGESDKIKTQLELEAILEHDPNSVKALKEVVMIQCVGSRNDDRPYCSKVCCTEALKNALIIKEQSPFTNVTILYREMRSYGLREELFTRARRAGVLFVRYGLDNQPVVSTDGSKPVIQYDVPRIGKMQTEADLLVLAAAIDPNDNADIAEKLKLPRTNENFFLEVHMKLAPVDFASDGVFMAGLAHSPKPIDETIAQAQAAAAKAASILSQEVMMVGGQVSVVEPDKCAVCLNCVRACPYGVPIIDSEIGAAYINPAECRGCGVCAAECPGQAIQLQHFTSKQIDSMINVVWEDRESV